MARASRFLTAAVMMAVGCGPLDNNSSRRDKDRATLLAERGVHIVAMAAGANGHRLVLIDENGDRLGDLTRLPPGGEIVRDNSPAWSPDGRWIVFVSSRERASMEETSLWIIAARAGAEPRRLTQGTAVDLAPTWTPDGKALVFSSNRGGGIHLWRLDLTPGPDGWPQTAGQPVQLTRGDHHDLYASVEPGSSGARIVYMRVNQDRSRSSLWLWSSGTETELTSGPADMTPAWSPEGRTIAFAAPSLAGDLDLHAIDPDGSNRRVLIIEPDGDQTGPVWSGDGRYLFATSTWRSRKTGKRLLFSITFVDMVESPLVVRALHDSSLVPSSRTSPALSRADLDAAALHRNLPYRDALKRAGERELNRRQSDGPD